MKNVKQILIIIICFVFLRDIVVSQQLNTKQISLPEGLSSSNVRSIIQDKYGFIWIATQEGLNRYDGYSFKVYKNIPGDSSSIVGNDIWQMRFDNNGNLWIATGQGASFYNRKTNSFRQYGFENIIPNYKSTVPQCVNLFIDNSDEVYFGTIGAGLLKYDKSKDSFNKVKYADSTSIYNEAFDIVTGITQNQNVVYAISFAEGLNRINNSGLLEEVKIIPDDPKINFKNFNERGAQLFTDANNIIWLISENGIYKYNKENQKLKSVKRYLTTRKDINFLWNGIDVDKEGNLWISKDNRGVFKFDGISDDYKEVKFWKSKEYTGQNNNSIPTLFFDKTGILWIGTFLSGIYLYDSSREPFTHYYYEPENPNSISGNELFSILESEVNLGKIYVGVRGGGLNVLDQKTKTFKREKIQLKNDMFGGSVRSILENPDGSLFLGTWGAGIIKFQNGKYKVVAEYDSAKQNSLSENRVRVLEKDDNGKIWVGTNGGLSIFDPKDYSIQRIYDKQIRVYNDKLLTFIRNKDKNKKIFKSILEVGDNENRTLSFKIDRPREYLVVNLGEQLIRDSLAADYGWITDSESTTIWTANGKLNYYGGGNNKNRVKIDIVKLTPGKYELHFKSDDSHGFGKWNANPSPDSLMWGIQLIELDDNEASLTKKYIDESENQLLIEASNIRSIHISGDIVWIGSDQQGLNKYNKVTKELKVYSNNPKQPNTISNNSVQYIYEDIDGILWLATNAGLNRFDPESEKFTVYGESDGLPTNYIASILEDDSGSIWIATRNGLSRMTIDKTDQRASFVNYDTKDGLGGTDFIALVALKSSDGDLYFGGEHGLNEFSPNKMNNLPPDIALTDIKISNKSVTQMGDDNPLSKLVMDAKSIELNHAQNDLSFEFAALHYSRADKNQYAHILEGFQKEWQYDNRKFAIYTNLDPGEYNFRVKGSNADGVWNYNGTSIKIKINPPWWRTTTAYISYGLFLIAIIFGVDRFQRRRLLAKVKERRIIEEAERRAETAELQARASEAERQILETEFQQKKKELEEARELQLSMLPKVLPQLANLDIAVYMQTATEVGGDYYDFHVSLDGTLTVVLGDATGHGMKAGTMVTSAKSLFNAFAGNAEIIPTFHEMTRCLKLMQMEKLSMCMTMLKIAGNSLRMSAAGMPPAILFRRDTRTIEEIVLKGMPLGTFQNFPYKLFETQINKGDTLLLMSDGFPELMNENKELFGYKAARNSFEEVAENSPEEIINKLKELGSNWTKDKDPDDDVTFVVIKVK